MEPTSPLEVPARLAVALADRYRIERPLGAGGMATVYLAEDIKHSRRVAVKVLKPELAAVLGADRFLTEIKTTANLQHPHILPLFDSGEADTYLYYVMPFIEGESLRDRLDRERQIGVEDAVRIARDVADALDYAHRHGVIHRDIKPANILLHDGRPLVADFGIALAISAAGGGRLTETGLSLGTPHYMSPEQASAERDLSARSDVYSLGCVLYEMLAGEPPHTGPNAAAILMRILTEVPRPISDLRATVPMHVASAVSKAVEKLPADRFETAKAFRDALDDAAFRFSRTTATAAASATTAHGGIGVSRTWDTRSKALAAASVVLAATTLWLAVRKPPAVAEPEGPISFQLADSVPDGMTPALGPGGWIAYGLRGTLHVRPPGSVQASPLAGADGIADENVTFSPDGEWIAYTQPNAGGTVVRKTPTRGGNPVTLATVKVPAISPYWGDDGWIYLTLGPQGAWSVARVPENGGDTETLLVTAEHIPYGYAKPPGREALLFGMFAPTIADQRVLALDLESRDTSTVVTGGYSPKWSPTGHVLYARNEGAVFAIPFDAGALRTTGSAVPVLDSLAEQFPAARFDVSPGGTLMYVAGRRSGGPTGISYTLRLDNLNGDREKIPLPPSDHWDAKFSPDGRQLAYIRNDHLWIYDLDLGTHTQLTKDGTRRHNPAWSPDGKFIVFSQGAADRPDVDLFVADVSGNAPPERFGGSDVDDFAAQWLPDSSVLVSTQGSKGENILVIRRGAAEVKPMLQADWVERSPRISPDGRWLAYVSGEGGRNHLYVRQWPALSHKAKVSEGDAPMATSGYAVWSNDSRVLYYHQGDEIIAASIVTAGDSARIASRRVIEKGVRGFLADLHPDGRRFLVMALEEAADTATVRSPRRLVVVTGWIASLRERLK